MRGWRCDEGMIRCRWIGTGEGWGEGAGEPALGVRLPGVEGWDGEGGMEGRADRGRPGVSGVTESWLRFFGVEVWRGVGP